MHSHMHLATLNIPFLQPSVGISHLNPSNWRLRRSPLLLDMGSPPAKSSALALSTTVEVETADSVAAVAACGSAAWGAAATATAPRTRWRATAIDFILCPQSVLEEGKDATAGGGHRHRRRRLQCAIFVFIFVTAIRYCDRVIFTLKSHLTLLPSTAPAIPSTYYGICMYLYHNTYHMYIGNIEEHVSINIAPIEEKCVYGTDNNLVKRGQTFPLFMGA